jgi:DNA-binding NtrC family response regulator
VKQLSSLPRILIIDDLFGRIHADRRNHERAMLCGSQYRLVDVTHDEPGKNLLEVKDPIAQVVFHRGQTPHCSRLGDTVENDLAGTLEMVRDGWVNPDKPRWALVLLDLCFYTGKVTEESNQRVLGMPEGRESDDDPADYFGLRILEAIQREFSDLPVAILSSKSRKEVSKEFANRGALAFLPRGEDGASEKLREYLWRHGLVPDDSGQIVGRSKAVLLALRAARRAARGEQNILFRGERGTGKELLADYIHRQSRGEGPLVAVNSAVFSQDLFASEMFGIEARTATGVEARRGLVDTAKGGDLFLDEIKDMPAQVQAAMLRLIEERETISVGGRHTRPVDVRFLSATNIDIEALAATDRFRFDLLDRLRSGGTIYLPPLRERREDIPLLAEKFVRDAERSHPGAMIREIEQDALNALCEYDWPGNVRELQACIYKAVRDYADVEHLVSIHIRLPKTPSSSHQQPTRSTDGSATPGIESERSGFDELFSALESIDFAEMKSSELAGKLTSLRSAHAQLLGRYLLAALEATRKPTPEHPDGEIMISPALKLMTGDKNLKTPRAADIIKQILRDCPDTAKSPVLKQALDYALSLRPRQSKGKATSVAVVSESEG